MTRIRFVSWNVHSCVGTDGRYDPRRIADVLRGLDADVIGLQEVDWRKPHLEGRDQFGYLADSLAMTPVEGPNLEDHLGHYGNGLLTRLAIEQVTTIEIAQPGREPRGLIDAVVHTNAGHLRALVTHLGLSWKERRRQMRSIADHLAHSEPESLPVVCMGDFNEWLPRRCSGVIRRTHACSLEAAPRSFPSSAPMFRLDRILVSESPQYEAVQVRAPRRCRDASDHLPVCVDLLLNSQSEDGASRPPQCCGS